MQRIETIKSQVSKGIVENRNVMYLCVWFSVLSLSARMNTLNKRNAYCLTGRYI